MRASQAPVYVGTVRGFSVAAGERSGIGYAVAKFLAFPPNPDKVVTDIVVVRSEDYSVDDPRFATFVQPACFSFSANLLDR